MHNIKFCEIHNCDYDKYYLKQAGGSLDFDEISYYTGKPFQRGYGIFSTFGRKYAMPFLKFVGKKAFKYGKNVLTDILQGDEPKAVLKRNLTKTANETIDDIKNKLNQKGKRRKRRQRKSKKPTKSRLNKKIKRKKGPKKTNKKRKIKKTKQKRKSSRRRKLKKRNSKNCFDL